MDKAINSSKSDESRQKSVMLQYLQTMSEKEKSKLFAELISDEKPMSKKKLNKEKKKHRKEKKAAKELKREQQDVKPKIEQNSGIKAYFK
jgi:hypothetical protein